MTSISLNLINRVKYQLCQSQKWQYHLCGDELCARRAATLFSEHRFGSTGIFWSQKSRLVANKGPFLERNDFWWLSGALIKSPWSKPRITNSSNDLPSYVAILQIIVCTLLVLAGSILLTSGQIAFKEPGLPFGYYTISLGKKKTCIQCLLVLFSPITLLLVRLQHQIVKKKWQRLQAGIYILQNNQKLCQNQNSMWRNFAMVFFLNLVTLISILCHYSSNCNLLPYQVLEFHQLDYLNLSRVLNWNVCLDLEKTIFFL